MPRERFATKAEIEAVLAQGGDVRDVAATFNVSRQTAYNAIHYYKLDSLARLEDRTSAVDEFGWDVRGEHVQDHHLRMLRYAWRKHRGRPIADPAREREAESWERMLRERDQVLTYHPGRGFGLSKRKDGDAWLWRPGHWSYPAQQPPRKPHVGRRAADER